MRIPIIDGYYNIGIYYNKKSTFLLFKTDSDFSTSSFKHNIKVNTFKNLESSMFCETFVNLHNYRKNTLDIVNQFDKIKSNYTDDVIFVLNESILLSKIQLGDKDVFDTLNIYGFTITSYVDEFIFIIAERHNVLTRLGKKIVRTTGIQISTTPALKLLQDYHKESLVEWKSGKQIEGKPGQIIKLSDAENEII
jgi:hypothetical protein